MINFNTKEFKNTHALAVDSGMHFFRPLFLAVLIGLGTGFLVVGFVKSIIWLTGFLFNPSIKHTAWVILTPVLGGLLVGPWVVWLAPEAKGHGIPEVLKAIVLRGSRIRPLVGVVKIVASIVSIGSGFSVGREGPIVQIGSAFGSSLGQWFNLPESRIRNLVACGAAAGIAGVFNTPIAGVMFASEVILRDFGTNALSTVVVAAVSSSIISRVFLGDHPSFTIPTYHLQHPLEIFLFFALGILAAVAAVCFMVTLEKAETTFEDWKFPVWLKTACAGLVVGCIGYFFPHIFGSGLPVIQDALNGNITLEILLVLIFLKIFATSISLGGGSSGGVFAPLLFIGAVLGGAFGQLASMHYFVPIAPSGAYALVGMASVFSAAARAPITAILIVFELTDGYGMILPIMIGVVTATSIAQMILRDSIYLEKLKRKGIDVRSLEEARILEGLKVNDVMVKDFCLVNKDTTAEELVKLMSHNKSKSIFVQSGSGVVTGVINPVQFNKILLSQGQDFLIAEDVAVPIKEYSFPEEPLNEAAKLMAAQHLGEIPVVDSLNTSKVIGVLKSEDIFRVYAEHVSKRGEITSRQAHDEAIPSDMITVVFTVNPRSLVVGKSIRELELPQGVHFNLVKRGDRFSVPHGNMLMTINDRVTAIVMPQYEQAFRDWLKDKRLKDF